jgi:hypothetical protein
LAYAHPSAYVYRRCNGRPVESRAAQLCIDPLIASYVA